MNDEEKFDKSYDWMRTYMLWSVFSIGMISLTGLGALFGMPNPFMLLLIAILFTVTLAVNIEGMVEAVKSTPEVEISRLFEKLRSDPNFLVRLLSRFLTKL